MTRKLLLSALLVCTLCATSGCALLAAGAAGGAVGYVASEADDD